MSAISSTLHTKRRYIAGWLMVLCLLLCSSAWASEGDPLLSIDDLLSIQGPFEALIDSVGEIAVRNGFLEASELSEWKRMQLGDFLSNGGYGSILINYMPGILKYAVEEEMPLELSASVGEGRTLEVLTMRRFESSEGTTTVLPIALSMQDAEGLPMPVRYEIGSNSGMLYKWDAGAGRYVSVGQSTESEGEIVGWIGEAPAVDASNVLIEIQAFTLDNDRSVAEAELTLYPSGAGYDLDISSLSGKGE